MRISPRIKKKIIIINKVIFFTKPKEIRLCFVNVRLFGEAVQLKVFLKMCVRLWCVG